MWERALIKSEAKMRLKQYYWSAFCVSIILGVITSVISGTVNFSTNMGTSILNNMYYGYYGDFNQMLMFILIALGITGISVIILFLVQVFLLNILTVGCNRFFMESREFPCGLDRMFFGFSSGGLNYKNMAKTLFMRDLYLFFWNFLSVIPMILGVIVWFNESFFVLGLTLILLSIPLSIPVIVKSYQYRMIPYLLAERPDMPWRRAFELSKLMTDHEKGRMWVLDLSFMGWWLLGLLTCGIGLLFIWPYYYATQAELYTALREKAFGLGFAQKDELCGFFQQ